MRLLFLLIPSLAWAQTVTLNESTVISASPQRLGINMSASNFYVGLIEKNYLYTINPGFEGYITQQNIACLSGSTTTCVGFYTYDLVPANYWAGVSFSLLHNGSITCSGTIASNSVATGGSTGATYTFSSACGSAVGASDYLIVRQQVNSTSNPPGWALSGSAAGEISDIPVGSAGVQALALPASAVATNFIDSTNTHDFLIFQTGQTYTFSLKTHISTGSPVLTVTLKRSTLTGGGLNCSGTLTPTSSWAMQTFTCPGTESTGTVYGTLTLNITNTGTGTANIDDVSFAQSSNLDGANTTVFRDEVVHALQAQKPGVLRNMELDMLGNSFASWTAGTYGSRWTQALQGESYTSATSARNSSGSTAPSLPDFLNLCQYLGASPWITIPLAWPTTEYASLITYISSNYSFSHVYLEFGNEPWNYNYGGIFMPGIGSDQQAPYGKWANTIGSTMAAASGWNGSIFQRYVNAQAANTNNWIVGILPNATSNIDGKSVAPYIGTGPLDTTGTLAAEWNPDAADAWADSNNTGVSGASWTYAYSANDTKSVGVYETNSSQVTGTTASVVQAHVSEIMMGTVAIQQMMEHLKLSNMGPQNLFSLVGDFFSNGTFNVPLWGTSKEYGGEWAGAGNYVLRPQGLAFQIANAAIIGTEYGSAVTGNVTFSSTASNSIPAIANVPYLSVYCFKNGMARSCSIFNTDPVSGHTLTFTGTNVPTSVTEQLLYDGGNGISANNESSTPQVSVKTTGSKTVTSGAYTIPAYSMSTISWSTGIFNGRIFGANTVKSGPTVHQQ